MRKITYCAGYKRTGQDKNKVAPKITKKWTFGNRLWKGKECNTNRNGVEDLYGGQPWYLKKPDLK
jgi:hypothetical protein